MLYKSSDLYIARLFLRFRKKVSKLLLGLLFATSKGLFSRRPGNLVVEFVDNLNSPNSTRRFPGDSDLEPFELPTLPPSNFSNSVTSSSRNRKLSKQSITHDIKSIIGGGLS